MILTLRHIIDYAIIDIIDIISLRHYAIIAIDADTPFSLTPLLILTLLTLLIID
jgi:hypothetical protein